MLYLILKILKNYFNQIFQLLSNRVGSDTKL